MPNYQLGKIYKIESNQCEQVYVGSTCEQYLSNRLSGHKRNYKRYLNGNGNYTSSYELLKYDDFKIYLIEDYPCERKEQLRSREGYWIKELDCVNKHIAGRTKKEWRDDNIEHVKEKRKKEYDENKETSKAYSKEWYENNKEQALKKCKEYRDNHKKEAKEYSAKYRKENAAKLKAHKSEKMTCEICGVQYSRNHKARHERSKFHLNFV